MSDNIPNLTFSRESPDRVADILGWACDLDVGDLVGALIYALKRINTLEHDVARLQPSRIVAEVEADQAAADLAAEKLEHDPSYTDED